MTNWVDLQKIREVSQKLLNHERYLTNLELITAHSSNFKTPNNNSIIILLHQSHYYSILWIKSLDKGLIADSNNLSLEEEMISEIRAITKLNIQGIRLEKKLKVDYCATAAIFASLEFARLYKGGDIGVQSLMFPQYLYNRVVAALHPEKSQPETGRKSIKEVR